MNYAEQIKDRLTMKEICQLYGIEISRSGFAKCPFHNERTASMKIYSHKGGYYCFGCGANGDVITFVQQYFNLNFKEAIEKINEDFCLGLSISKRLSLREREQLRKMDKERKIKERERLLERERLNNEYWAAFSEWQKYDAAIRLYKPQSPEGIPKSEFLDALSKVEDAKYKLDLAEKARYDYENRN